MKARLLIPIFVLAGAPLLAQAPAAQAHISALGFSYSLPSEWEVVDAKSTLPAVRQQAITGAASEGEIKGITCTQVALTARHGSPATVVVVVALPFDCYGQAMTQNEMTDFAHGAPESLKQSFDLTEPVFGAYKLGSHSMWIERANGAPKGQPKEKYTVEVVCSALKKAAVCWMAMAADDAGLQAFEQGAVTLDGETAAALVPAEAFKKQP